jgi:hypothetical protein
MIYIVVFIAVWLSFYMLVDRNRIGELLPSMIFAGYLGIITDILMLHNRIWEYNHYKPLPHWSVAFLFDIGIYAVVSGLYIQWLPEKRIHQWFYTIPWTTGAILFEYAFIRTEYMHHHKGWTLLSSYLADWFIFYLIILQYHFYRKAPKFISSR